MWRAAEASTYVKAPRSVVYSVLATYDLYRTWVPDLTGSRLFAREGDIAIAELICPRYGGDKFLLELIETQEESILFRRIDRDRVELTGAWRLEETDGGESTVVRLSLRVKTGLHQIFAGRATREMLQRTVEALKERCLRLAADPTSDDAGAEVILDLVRAGGTLTVQIGGQGFSLSAGPESE